MCIELALLKITFSDVSGDASILVLVVVEAWLLTTWHATRPDFWKVISKQVLHLHFSNRLGLLVGKKACFLSNAINPGVWGWPQVTLNSPSRSIGGTLESYTTVAFVIRFLRRRFGLPARWITIA